MDFNIEVLADQVKEYGEYTGRAVSRNCDGLLVYVIEHYMLNDCRFSLHYKNVFDKSVLQRVEISKV